MAPGASHTFQTIPGWAGRMWGKLHCKEDGTGCDDTPATLAEFTLGQKVGEMDFYDVSLVDGYNVAMMVEPIAGTYTKKGNNHYDCARAGCSSDLNAHCPEELSVKRDGKTIACLSACAKFKTDEYCCGGKHNTPQTCKSTDWPKNYPAIFKAACPEAYSYAYDDQKSTFTCHGNPQTGYVITFCPYK